MLFAHTYSNAQNATKPVIFSMFLSFIPSASGYFVLYFFETRSLVSEHKTSEHKRSSKDGNFSFFCFFVAQVWLHVDGYYHISWLCYKYWSPCCNIPTSSDVGQRNVCSLFFTLLPRKVQEFQLICFVFPIPIPCTDHRQKVSGLPMWNQQMTFLCLG